MILDVSFVLLLLLAGFIGFKTGLIKTFKWVLPFVSAVLLAVFVCIPLANSLADTSLAQSFFASVEGWFSDLGDLNYASYRLCFDYDRIYLNAYCGTQFTLIEILVERVWIFARIIESIVIRSIPPVSGPYIYTQLIPQIARVMLVGLCFLAVFVLSWLVFGTTTLLVSKKIKSPPSVIVNGTIGSFIWLVMMVVIIYALFALLTYFADGIAGTRLIEYAQDSSFIVYPIWNWRAR